MAGIEKIFQHPEQIEIHEARRLAEQKGMVRQHFLEGQQVLLQLFEPVGLLRAPLVNAAAPELALLVPQKCELLGGRHVFLPVNVVEPERRAFDFVFDVAPEDGLDALKLEREQAELQLRRPDIWR